MLKGREIGGLLTLIGGIGLLLIIAYESLIHFGIIACLSVLCIELIILGMTILGDL